jgi:hypothetical protein
VVRKGGSIEVDDVLYTATVHTRHSADCPKRDQGGRYADCDCRKSVLVWNGKTGEQNMFSAKTRSWDKAKAKAEEWLDQFDPYKIERKREEAAAVPVEKAIASFIADKKFQKISKKTLDRNRALLGDPDNNRERKLLPWLAAQNPPIQFETDHPGG